MLNHLTLRVCFVRAMPQIFKTFIFLKVSRKKHVEKYCKYMFISKCKKETPRNAKYIQTTHKDIHTYYLT